MPERNIRKPMLSIIALLPFTFSALAQDVAQAVNEADKNDTAGLEVIQVTAQKRVTSLQETPIAISAFSRAMLDDQDIEDAFDIQFAVPNAMISNNASYNIRGVGNNAISSTADPGLGVHVNGVYVTANTIQNEFYDLESIEVLRGPQGTLFGRNTTAGVLNSITRRPDDTFAAALTTEIASFNGLRTKGFVNIPISDSVLQRFAFNTVKRDGYTENLAENVGFDNIDGRDQFSVRSSTTFEFSDSANGFLFAQYFKENSDRAPRTGVLCTSDPILGCDNDTVSNQYPNTDFIDGSLANGGLAPTLGALGFATRSDFYNTNLDGSPRTNPSDPRQVRQDYQPVFNAEDLLVSFEFNYEFSDFVFTSVTAYHDRSNQAFADFDNADGADALFTPQSLLLPEGRTQPTTRHSTARSSESDSDQWSQEFRIASFQDGPFNFTAGAFYLEYDATSFGKFYLPETTALAGALSLPDELASFNFDTPELTTTSWAIFSEGYYDLSEDLKLTVGLRYTEEEKEVKTRAISPLSFLNPAFDINNSFVDGDGAWEEVTGKIGLSYTPNLDMTDETLFFGTLSRGYKGGGINPGANETSFPTFDPEYINALEFGTKNTFANRTLQANATVFVYQYDGLQVGGILGDGNTFNTNVDADVKGAEFEFLSMPIDGLRINLNLALLDSEINEDFFTSPDIAEPSGSGPVNLKGKTLTFSPESSVQFGIQYTHEVADNWEVAYRLQTFWQDEFYTRLYNAPSDLQDNWQQTDVSVTLRDMDDIWELEAFVKNASDEASITGSSVANSLVGRYRTPQYLDPRTYGVRITYRFE
jgi:outer membrane receptor protein involved in Fe transport